MRGPARNHHPLVFRAASRQDAVRALLDHAGPGR